MWAEYIVIIVGLYLAFGLLGTVQNIFWLVQNVPGGVTQEEFLNAFFCRSDGMARVYQPSVLHGI